MSNIVTVTLNPTIDYASTAPHVFPDEKLRCTHPEIDPGGGGINVSRAIKALGGSSTALIAIGGNTGAQLLQLLAFEGISTVAIQGPGDTRQSMSVIDESTGQQYRFVMPGPDWHEADLGRALSAIDQAAGDDALIVLSGSQPPGIAKDFPSILAEHMEGRNSRIIVDTSGPALAHITEEPRAAIYALRMDGPEAEELAGHALPERRDTADFAESLIERGVADSIIVARGADGSVLATKNGSWHSTGARVAVRSKVGAGDSFVGAFTWALANGKAPEECIRCGAAAASAAVATEATRMFDRDAYGMLLSQCALTRL